MVGKSVPVIIFEPIIRRTLNQLLSGREHWKNEIVETRATKLIVLQYRGKMSGKYEKFLKSCKAPCKVIQGVSKKR